MPSRSKKSWHDKLHDAKDLPKVIRVDDSTKVRWAAGSYVVPAPIDVDAVMRSVHKGRLITTDEIRRSLASQAQTDFACPLTTGIFCWIAAHAAFEAEQAGAKRVTPWWRTLKAKGELNPKFPGGLDQQRALLEAEGHTVVVRGKRMFVDGYERAVFQSSSRRQHALQVR